MQVTLCQEGRRDEAGAHDVDMTGTYHSYDMESAATTLANYVGVPKTYQDADTNNEEEVIATENFTVNDEKFVVNTLATIADKKSAAATHADYIDKPGTDNDARMHADDINDEEFDAATLQSTTRSMLLSTPLPPPNKKNAADDLAIYDEESATLASHDEENAAVEGEPGRGHN